DPNHSASAIRVYGALGSAYSTAGALVAAAGFGLLRYTLLRDRRRCRAELASLVIIACAIVATLTRAAVVALVVLVGCWAVQRQLRAVAAISLRVRLLAVGAAALAIAVPVIGAEALQARLADVNPLSAGQNFAQGRAGLWSGKLSSFDSGSPVGLGIGHGLHSSCDSVPGAASDLQLSPHNALIWLLIETGILGTLVYGSFLLTLGHAFRGATLRGRFAPMGQAGAAGLATLLAFLVLNAFHLAVNSP